MSYRPPSRQPRGAWARHLHEQRRLRDLSQTQAFEAVFERIGWSRKSRTAYVAIDMGTRQPKPEEAAVLGAEFGWPPDPEVVEPDPDLTSVLSAIATELGAIRREREEIARERAEWTRGVVEVLRAYEAGQVPTALLDALAPAPRANAQP